MRQKRILDTSEEIKRIDKSSMLSFCIEASKHYGEAAKIAEIASISIHFEPQTIIVAGMGGSAIGGELLKDWAWDKIAVPIEVYREYSLPAYVDKNTLVFVVSYSGETEESLSVFLDAIKRKCMIFCLGSGGKLLEFAEKLDAPYLRIPSGMPPRAALPYLFLPMISIIGRIGLVSDVNPEISEALKVLKQVSSENSPDKPLRDNFSKMLATNISGSVPVVCGFEIYRAVARRFKQQFNENSKIPAKCEFFPELNHNEIVGWEEAGELSKIFSAIFIRDKDEREEIHHRIEATQKLIHAKSLRVFEVWSRGSGRLAKMLSAICIGDFASVYLAILRGVDPTPVKTIALLKEKMRQTGIKEKIIRELQVLAAR